ncbi:MAG: PocR ligand-binding domain-containing protein, partial [Lachnospiraceae bacterium]|nr:PocR ligand-binding domain-containing protein [Lachnospiraceae bacterium]
KATGLAFVTVDYTGNPVTKYSCYSGFCAARRADDARCEICKKSDAFGALQAAITHKPFIYKCPCELLEFAIPIEDHGNLLGGLIGGQVYCEDAPENIIHLSQLFGTDEVYSCEEGQGAVPQGVKKYSYSHFLEVVSLIHLIIAQVFEGALTKRENASQERDFAGGDDSYAELRRRNHHLEQKLSQFLANQNSYFFSNVLSTISGSAILEDAPKTNELLLNLSDYFTKSTLDSELYWSLQEEVDLCENYIRLACARLGDRFTYQVYLPENLKNERIPVYTVLPFVQDAVYYGVSLKKDETNLAISISKENDDLLVSINENGPGYDYNELKERFAELLGKHEGEYIDRFRFRTEKRLLDGFGEKYRPEISIGKGVGRKFKIRIPSMNEEKEVL